MSYKALYLKYRPQTFEEVAGQTAIVRTLKNSLSNGKIAHAYLFSGPRGTGKTSMARLFAKALNCSEGIGHQCGVCENCQAIAEGSHPDIMEVDAASNNGVEQVRDLIEKVKYAPLQGKYKVYIIDEVHMMSTGAFNALLKTLEEPPENVIFILCTTEPHKVLPTILSRCQRFDFGKVGEADMKAKLVEVLNAEGVSYDDSALASVISLADGGMRDAFSILDQVIAYSGDAIKEKDILDLYGLASIDEKMELIEASANGDVSTVVGKTDGYLAGGIDIRRLTADLIAVLKDALVYIKTKNPTLLNVLKENQAKKLASFLNARKAMGMIDVLIDAQNDFKNVNDVRSLFELSLLKISSSNEEKEAVIAPKPAPKPIIEEIKEEPKPIEPEPVATQMEEAPTPIVVQTPAEPPKKEEPRPEARPLPKLNVSDKPKSEPPAFLLGEEQPKPAPRIDTSKIIALNIATEGDQYNLSDDEIIKAMVIADKGERIQLLNRWPELDGLRNDEKLGNLASLLADGKPYVLCKELIIIRYGFAKQKAKTNIRVNQEPLQELLKQILGRKVFIYGVDGSDVNRIMNHYYSLQSVSKLPAKSEVSLVLPK